MSLGALITLTIAAALLIYIAVLYNGLVSLKHNAVKALANIDVL